MESMDHCRLIGSIKYTDEKGKQAINIKEGIHLFADYLVHNNHIITTKNDNMYIYDNVDGMYNNGGEQQIQNAYHTAWNELGNRYGYNEVLFKVKSQTRIQEDTLNPPLHLIPLNNGVYDINTKELIPYNPTHLFTYKIPVDYNKEATCPHIDAFIQSVLPEQQQPLAYEIPGYCLYRSYPLQKLFILNGGGANGKSTYLNLLRNLLGNHNVTSVNPQNLISGSFLSSKLFSKLANIGGDIPETGITDSGQLKQLTGGDLITANPKFQKPFEFVNYAKLIFSCNQIPSTNDDTFAQWRRITIVDFPYKFVDNPVEEFDRKVDINLINKLVEPGELSGFLNKCLEGLDRILQQGHFSFERNVVEERKKYLMKSDSVKTFVEDCLVFDESNELLKSELYGCYIDYCNFYNLKRVSAEEFGKSLKNHFYVEDARPHVGGKRVMVWIGVSYKKELVQAGQGGHTYFSFNYVERNNNNNIYIEPTKEKTPAHLDHPVQSVPLIADNPKSDYDAVLDYILNNKLCSLEKIRALGILNVEKILSQLSHIGKIYQPYHEIYDLVDREKYQT